MVEMALIFAVSIGVLAFAVNIALSLFPTQPGGKRAHLIGVLKRPITLYRYRWVLKYQSSVTASAPMPSITAG